MTPEHYHSDPEYLTEVLILAINEQIVALMDDQKVTKAEIARRMGVKPPYITKLLRGTPNTSLLTLVKVATALGVKIDVQFARAKR